MNEITTVGLDLAKRVVSPCGEDNAGRVVVQRTLRREAVRQPQLRFATVKSAAQQARLVVHRLRQGWQEQRTATINRLRGLLAEFGRVYPNSASAALADETLPAAMRVAPE